ncbi:nucleotidyl transferase AbiEii/AbiGii toxin family protein [Microbacterium sp.]|uniref:nucleotidyl transferase AbiEii/AbiGii toxin family protein n=1 Tax=Microbacterium sp. TaxID=51671 RepID=UPI002736D898|nr:nucleotidyl transferase AbiEii/AbiGii toxin family protein [Microbacterium sp.]MDP3951061.1 nucleotidyl transferase AbiEii/AbiGii toxin family protein [Microbacterium sp.]
MTRRQSYESPAAFRRGLTDKLKVIAANGKWSLTQLQRQIAYDRLLERLYLVDGGWVVKGAAALLARDIGVRATIDIDLYRKLACEAAEREMREAVGHDIGDWFRFEAGPSRAVAMAVRIPVTARIGTVWAEFHVDLQGEGLVMTGDPEPMPPLARIIMPDIEQHGYQVYPLVDHIADKITATVQRYGEGELPSTRYKDLVDLVAIIREASIQSTAQMAALRSEAARRKLTLPRRFAVPDRPLWEAGYASEAQRSLLETALTLDEALAAVEPFIDPLLDGTAAGTWVPELAAWHT